MCVMSNENKGNEPAAVKPSMLGIIVAILLIALALFLAR